MTTQIALSFQDFKFNVVDRNNNIWLKQAEIVCALYGVSKGGGQDDTPFENAETALKRLYKRNSDEFTDTMTALVELDTNGGKQQVRIFSLRGCHLLAMFARTEIAKEFRKWVLDIIDHHLDRIETTAERKTKRALPGCLTPEHQDIIKAMVTGRADGLPNDKKAGVVIKGWAAIKSKYGASYKNIPDSEFLNVVSLLARLPITPDQPKTGEYLTKQEAEQLFNNMLEKHTAPLSRTGERLPNNKIAVPVSFSISDLVYIMQNNGYTVKQH